MGDGAIQENIIGKRAKEQTMRVLNSKCTYPDWEGGLEIGEHVFSDGSCIVCGEMERRPLNKSGPTYLGHEWADVFLPEGDDDQHNEA